MSNKHQQPKPGATLGRALNQPKQTNDHFGDCAQVPPPLAAQPSTALESLITKLDHQASRLFNKVNQLEIIGDKLICDSSPAKSEDCTFPGNLLGQLQYLAEYFERQNDRLDNQVAKFSNLI